MSMGRILVAEDKQSMREMLAMALDQAGYDVTQTSDGDEALAKLRGGKYDLVLSDLKMPKLDGMQLLEATRKLASPPAFIMITAHGSIPDAVKAMALGAFDFLEKPFDLEELEFKVADAIGRHAPIGSGGSPLDGVVGNSPQMLEVADIVRRVAESSLPVLVLGEDGTGKALLAGKLHELGPRADKPLVTVDCAAPAGHGVEDTLFGHEKGAFKDAAKREPGALEKANGGTLVLDSIEALSPSTQQRVLRFLQEKRFEREGGSASVEADVRVIALSSRDLRAMTEEGTFRQDLYYKICAVTASLPALRDRLDDLKQLTEHFLAQANKTHNRKVALSPRVQKVLREYQWPGNVGELAAVIERCVVIAAGDTLAEAELPEEVRNPRPAGKAGLTTDLEGIERQRLVEALEKNDWNQTRAAKFLGIGRTALQYKMQKYALKKPG